MASSRGRFEAEVKTLSWPFTIPMVVTSCQVTAQQSQQLRFYEPKSKCKNFAHAPCITLARYELSCFINLKVSRGKTASKAIGIEEIRGYLDKKIEKSDLIEKISIKTRQYAKRQTTWGRGNMFDWNKIKSDGLNKFLKKV